MAPPTPRLENQPPTIGHSRKVVSLKTEASLQNYPCGLRGIKRCKCTVIVQDTSTSSSSSSAFFSFFFFPGVNSAAARSARTVPACPAHTGARHTAATSGGRRKGTSGRQEKDGERLWVSPDVWMDRVSTETDVAEGRVCEEAPTRSS